MQISMLFLCLFLLFVISVQAQNIDLHRDTVTYLGQKPPGMVPEIFAPGIVSTQNHAEFSCTFSPDGSEFYFARVGGELRGNREILVCRFKEDTLSNPEIVSFNSPQTDNEPHITHNGRRMFFNSTRPHPDVPQDFYGLWYVDLTDKGWGDPQFFKQGMFVSSTKNGDLYYTDLTDETDRGVIVRADFVNGTYTEPYVQLGGVQSPQLDAHPCISPDERFIVFDSNRPGGYGSSDLYVSFRNEDETWGRAINLGPKINNESFSNCPCLSPDGKYLFYSHDNNIYWVDAKVIHELKPNNTR